MFLSRDCTGARGPFVEAFNVDPLSATDGAFVVLDVPVGAVVAVCAEFDNEVVVGPPRLNSEAGAAVVGAADAEVVPPSLNKVVGAADAVVAGSAVVAGVPPKLNRPDVAAAVVVGVDAEVAEGGD